MPAGCKTFRFFSQIEPKCFSLLQNVVLTRTSNATKEFQTYAYDVPLVRPSLRSEWSLATKTNMHPNNIKTCLIVSTFEWGFMIIFILHCIPLDDWGIICQKKRKKKRRHFLFIPTALQQFDTNNFFKGFLIKRVFPLTLAPRTWKNSNNKRIWLQWQHAQHNAHLFLVQ